MVRLKVKKAYVIAVFDNMFQFQNGTIKSQLYLYGKCVHLMFQFQNGTIKSIYQHLKRNGFGVFQFQNGTIKSLQLSVAEGLFVLVSIPKWYD